MPDPYLIIPTVPGTVTTVNFMPGPYSAIHSVSDPDPNVHFMPDANLTIRVIPYWILFLIIYNVFQILSDLDPTMHIMPDSYPSETMPDPEPTINLNQVEKAIF